MFHARGCQERPMVVANWKNRSTRQDEGRINVMANGLPVWGGVQLATGGAALRVAERVKARSACTASGVRCRVCVALVCALGLAAVRPLPPAFFSLPLSGAANVDGDMPLFVTSSFFLANCMPWSVEWTFGVV